MPFPDPDTLAWDPVTGLLPAVVQDADTLRVLMLAYMDRGALRTTRESGKVSFFSRSRQQAWTKGETSGNFLTLVSIQADCDDDTLLVLARPQGPTCHLQRTSCFADAPGGIRRIAQKVGEEGVETALAAVVEDDDALAGEAADLMFHLLVLLRARGLSLDAALTVLRERHGNR